MGLWTTCLFCGEDFHDEDTKCLAQAHELIAALRAQLAVAEERARKADEGITERDEIINQIIDERESWKRGHHKIKNELAAARADAVREFAEWLDETGHDIESSGVHDRKIFENADAALKFYLSTLAALRARPDDGRVERVRELIDQLKAESDSSYCAGLQHSMSHCAGAEAKMADGSFTMTDLAHHERGNRLDERHRVLSEVVGKIRGFLAAADGAERGGR
jgi:hypothetical protein